MWNLEIENFFAFILQHHVIGNTSDLLVNLKREEKVAHKIELYFRRYESKEIKFSLNM